MVNKYPSWIKLVFGHQRYAYLMLYLAFRSLKENFSFQFKKTKPNPNQKQPPQKTPTKPKPKHNKKAHKTNKKKHKTKKQPIHKTILCEVNL